MSPDRHKAAAASDMGKASLHETPRASVIETANFAGKPGRRGVHQGAPAAQGLEQWRQLVRVGQELMLAGDASQVHRLVSTAARHLLGADGAAIIRLTNGECHYAEESAMAPLWKGLRLPMEGCISGSSMLHRVPIVIEDIEHDPRLAAGMYRSTFVRSLAMVPVRKSDPLGAIGVYWARRCRPDELQLGLLQALADSAAAALDNIALLHALEDRVRERTQALQSAYQEFQQLALVDDLTGLRNRRGFFLLAEQQRRQVARSGDPAFIVFVDVDGLKDVNDTLGHEAGDQLLRQAARVLQATFRDADIIARLGGDEFCVLAVDGVCNPQMIRERLQHNIDAFNAGRPGTPFPLAASIGIYPCDANDHTPLEQLVRYADQDMYLQKRSGRRVTILAERREAARRGGSVRPPLGDESDGN